MTDNTEKKPGVSPSFTGSLRWPCQEHGAPAAVPEDLRARCAEILSWQKSGVLKGDALRGYARSQWYADEHNSLQMAEADTARQAYSVIAGALTTPAPAAQESVAWRVSDPGEPEIGHWLSEEPGASWQKSEPLYTAPPAAEQPDSTTSDRYRAELYDEVWQKARDMGYGNVTEALIALERMRAAEQGEGAQK